MERAKKCFSSAFIISATLKILAKFYMLYLQFSFCRQSNFNMLKMFAQIGLYSVETYPDIYNLSM